MNDADPSPSQDDERERFVIGPKWVNTIPTWELNITPKEVTITPATTGWRSVLVLNVICVVAWLLFLGVVSLYAKENVKMPATVISLIVMLISAAGLTVLTLRQHWQAQALGPWLIIDRERRTVTLPRHQRTISCEQVDHLQSISGTRYQQSIVSDAGKMSELNIVLREANSCHRYDLLCHVGNRKFDDMAQQIARLDLLPVKQIHSVWSPRRIDERWLTSPARDEIA